MQPGDVPVTYADTTPLERVFGFKPSTSLRDVCVRLRSGMEKRVFDVL